MIILKLTINYYYNLDHLSVDNDHLDIAVNYHKGDQTGSLGRVKKPIFANPTLWQVCPIVALGIVLFSLSRITSKMDIFSNTRIDVLFTDWLKSILVKTRSLDGRNLTSHLTRKGSSSWSCSTAGLVNVIQVWLHCGWNLGGVLPEYIKAENGGGLSVGRCNSLLPHNTDFSLLPPRFKPDANIPWSDMIPNYEEIPQNMKLVLKFVVPSIIYFAQPIRETLHSRNPLFLSKFWTNSWQTKLQTNILPPVKMFCPETNMRATGIPPMIQMQYANETQMQCLNSRMESVEKKLDELKS